MQTIDKHFRNLTQTVFKKHGFAQGDVLALWPQIVGAELAGITLPEKIRWPRGENAAQGGTLHLKVAAGRALDVQYAAQSIADKVNAYLGYSAVSALKLVQSHGPLHPQRQKMEVPHPPPAIVAKVARIEDASLQAALARLGAGVSASAIRSPQAKEHHGFQPFISSRTP